MNVIKYEDCKKCKFNIGVKELDYGAYKAIYCVFTGDVKEISVNKGLVDCPKMKNDEKEKQIWVTGGIEPQEKPEQKKCGTCKAFSKDKGRCFLTPTEHVKHSTDWCLQWL